MATDPSPDDTHSRRYNSYTQSERWKKPIPRPLKSRILEVIEESEIELTPLQIAEKLHANHSSVRVYLPQLVADNQIVTPYKGAYCSKITHGVRFQGIRVHNIVVTSPSKIHEHLDIRETVGTVKVRVLFGTERDNVTIFISCDAGMDKNSCLLAMDKGFHIAKEKLGRELENLEVKTFELNRDYLGVRVDRATCITRVGLYDMVERVYQKEQGVRHEVKVSTPMPLKDFEALLQGGVTNYNLTQANFALVQEVKKLVEAQKMTNDILHQQGRLLEALTKRFWKMMDDDKDR